MKRLVPEEVAKLFEKHNLRAKTGNHFAKWIPTLDGGHYRTLYVYTDNIKKEDVQACCGIGICLYDVNIFKATEENPVETQLGLERDYRRSFENGFDDYQHKPDRTTFHSTGYEDGWKTAKIVFTKQEKQS